MKTRPVDPRGNERFSHLATRDDRKKKKGSEAVFSEEARRNKACTREFLNGFHKRKVQRQKVAQKQLEKEVRQKRVKDRSERRAKLPGAGLPLESAGVGGAGEEAEENDEEDGAALGQKSKEQVRGVHKQAVLYGSSIVTVDAM